jgi:hypothetical protein
VTRERRRRIDASVNTSPKNIFRARLRVGEREIGMAFMKGWSPVCRALPEARVFDQPGWMNPRAVFII